MMIYGCQCSERFALQPHFVSCQRYISPEREIAKDSRLYVPWKHHPLFNPPILAINISYYTVNNFANYQKKRIKTSGDRIAYL